MSLATPESRRFPRWAEQLCCLLLIGLLVGCAGSSKKPVTGSGDRQYEPLDGPPSTPFNVDEIPEPVVKREPRSRYGNHSPYVVLGKRYHVMESAQGYHERGTASWYGTKFHGRLTSNREPYDMFAFTAAHKSLPLPTYVRVTNLSNGKSLVVRVNDRGPFVGDRIIDLSYAAAVKLGVHLTGTAPVEVQALGPGGEPLQASESGTDYLQVGAFAEKANAQALAARLREADLRPVKVVRSRSNGKRVYRVRIGPVEDETQISRIDQILRRLDLPAAIRVRRD